MQNCAELCRKEQNSGKQRRLGGGGRVEGIAQLQTAAGSRCPHLLLNIIVIHLVLHNVIIIIHLFILIILLNIIIIFLNITIHNIIISILNIVIIILNNPITIICIIFPILTIIVILSIQITTSSPLQHHHISFRDAQLLIHLKRHP